MAPSAPRRRGHARSGDRQAVEQHRFEPLTRLSWQHQPAFPIGQGVAEEPRRAAARSRSRCRPRDADDQLALQLLRRNAEGDAARHSPPGGAPVVGSLPDPRFPQNDERRQPCRGFSRIASHISSRADRAAAEPLGRLADRAARSPRRRYRCVDGTDRPYPHLGPTSPTAAIEVDNAASWQERARGSRGPPVGRAARAHYPAFRRSPVGFLVRHLSPATLSCSGAASIAKVRCRSRALLRRTGSTGSASFPGRRGGAAMRTSLTAANRVLRGEVASRAAAARRRWRRCLRDRRGRPGCAGAARPVGRIASPARRS